MVYKVFRGNRHVGYVHAPSNSAALERAHSIRPEEPGALSVSQPSTLEYDSLPKEMLAGILNERLKINVPWTRFSREDLLLVVYAVLKV